MKKLAFALCASALALAPAIGSAQIVTNVNQVGANVVVSTTGSISLTGLTSAGNYGLSLGIAGNQGYVAGGTDGATVVGYTGFTGATTFGSGAYIAATSGSGVNYAFNGNGFGTPYLFLPTTYTSGSAIVSGSIFNNATLASLGLTTGQYVWRSTNGTVTVNIGANAVVPEPATWAMMILGMGVAGYALRRRIRRSEERFDLQIKRLSEGEVA